MSPRSLRGDASGRLNAFQPRGAARAGSGGGDGIARVVAEEQRDRAAEVSITAVYPSRDLVAPKTRAFVEMLATHVARRPLLDLD